MSEILAKDIMTKEVITASPDDDVEKVARLLAEHQISGMPVVDQEQRVVGMISEADLVLREKKVDPPRYTEILGAVLYLESPKKFFEELKKVIALEVQELMSPTVYSVDEDAGIDEVASILVEKKVNRVPVLDKEQRLVGLITRQDILKARYGNK